jgi:hypothetical protein
MTDGSPRCGVRHALRNIHVALVPNGLLVDTQPISAHPRVMANGTELGTLDMRERVETITRSTSGSTRRSPRACTSWWTSESSSSRVPSIDGPDCLEITGV